MPRAIISGGCLFSLKTRFPLENFALIFTFRFPHMDASSRLAPHPHAEPDPHQHDAGHDHHELPFWRKYIISTDHKVIGIQYGITGLIFLFFGFFLMMLMRWQLAYPGQALPVIGNWLGQLFGPGSMPDGKMTPEFYNSLGAMHGTIMIFLGIVPIAFAARPQDQQGIRDDLLDIVRLAHGQLHGVTSSFRRCGSTRCVDKESGKDDDHHE